MLEFLFVVLGFLLLIKGADFLVDGASSIAKKFGIPEIVIGLTIVSVGTSMPELFISVTSALKGYSDMTIGNVVGSNLANLLLILGITAIVKPVLFERETVKYEIPICLASTILLYVFANTSNLISRAESGILLIFFSLFIVYTIVLAKRKKIKKQKTKSKTSLSKDIILMILGVLGLKYGGDLTVDNAVKIAELLGLSAKVISITILAIGTSLPELVTSVSAAKKGESDLAIGNIIGSNIFNVFLIIGVSSFISPINYSVSYNFDLIYLFFALILLLIFAYTKPKLKMSRTNGIIYFLGYVVYMIILFII